SSLTSSPSICSPSKLPRSITAGSATVPYPSRRLIVASSIHSNQPSHTCPQSAAFSNAQPTRRRVGNTENTLSYYSQLMCVVLSFRFLVSQLVLRRRLSPFCLIL